MSILEAIKPLFEVAQPILIVVIGGLGMRKWFDYTEKSDNQRELDNKRHEIEIKRLEVEEAELAARERALTEKK